MCNELKAEPIEYLVRSDNKNYFIIKKNTPKPLNHIKSEYELKCETIGYKTDFNWYVCVMRDGFRDVSKFDFQNTFVGFENGFESLSEALFILNLYIKKDFEMLVWLGNQ